MLIQRIVRGRMFYVVFACLAIFLYAHAAYQAHRHPPLSDTHIGALHAKEYPQELWPNREAMEAAVKRQPGAAALLSMLTLFGLMLAIAGVALTVWILASGRLSDMARPGARPLPPWSFGELGRIVMLIGLVVMLFPFVRITVMSYRLGVDMGSYLLLAGAMLFDLLMIVAVLTFAAGKRHSIQETLGLTRHVGWSSIRTGLVSYVAIFPWLIGLLFTSAELAHRLKLQPPVEPIQRLLFEPHEPLVIGLTVVLACLVGPIAEELLFRGVLYPALRRRLSPIIAMLISGVAFSLVHTNLLGAASITLIGCLLANVYERTGSLVGPIVVHIVHNTLLMSMALVIRQLLLG